MMQQEDNNSTAIIEVPSRIREYFKENQIEKEVLSLYFGRKKLTESKLKQIEDIKDREVIEMALQETEVEKNEVENANKIIIDSSIKLWPRLVGYFSLDELKRLLLSKIFIDVKIFAFKDISIYKKVIK